MVESSAMKGLLPFVLLATAAPAFASQAAAVTVEGLARASDAVVRGRVVNVTFRTSEDGRRIFTYAEVEPTATWRGTAPRRLTIVTSGGISGNVAQRVNGAAQFTLGEDVVVFLQRAEPGTFRVASMAQGKFTVDGAMALPDLSGIAFVPTTLQPDERRAGPVSLAELERRVRRAK
jgi:hypothetical protein